MPDTNPVALFSHVYMQPRSSWSPRASLSALFSCSEHLAADGLMALTTDLSEGKQDEHETHRVARR